MSEHAEISPTVSACRRFNLGDAMILTAGLAGFLGTARIELLVLPRQLTVWWYYVSAWLGWWSPLRVGQMSRRELAIEFLTSVSIYGAGLLIPAMFFATPAILAIRLRRPRGSLAAILRQPGAVACFSAALSFLVALDVALLSGRSMPLCLSAVGVSVIAGGVGLRLIGRRPEPGWIDRSGRVVGLGWVVGSLFSAAVGAL